MTTGYLTGQFASSSPIGAPLLQLYFEIHEDRTLLCISCRSCWHCFICDLDKFVGFDLHHYIFVFVHIHLLCTFFIHLFIPLIFYFTSFQSFYRRPVIYLPALSIDQRDSLRMEITLPNPCIFPINRILIT